MSDEEISTETTSAAGFGAASAVRILLSWAIAGASLAVVAGFIWWMVSIGTRDPLEVPIIQAMEGPARVQPDDPGGERTSHQGLAVNAVQASGGVEEPPRRVVLAPPPEELSEDDLTLGEARRRAEAERAPVEAVAEADPEPEAARSDEELDAIEIADRVAEAEAGRETARSDPDLRPNPVQNASPQAPDRSLRPRPRPAILPTEIAYVQPTAARLAATVTEGPGVPVGTRLIQLGAYDDPKLAESEWSRLLARHADLLEDKRPLIVKTQNDTRTFYRLRAAGFETAEESRALCSALLARGTACLAVTAR